MVTNIEEMADEESRLRQLRSLVDRAQGDIRAGRIPPDKVDQIINGLRLDAERLFPGTANTFDLIYRPRLERAAREAQGEMVA